MMLESTDLIADYIARNRGFEECILEDVRWRHYGTVVDLVFDYVWVSDGTVRSDFEPSNLKVLTFHNVQEFHLFNGQSEHMALHPEELNWGASEVAAVRIVDEPGILRSYAHLPIPIHHVRCAWEGDRRIDIVFSTLEVV